MAKRYNVSDGKLVLTLEEAGRGWYAVTSPMEPALTTQARNLPEAFAMARDALNELAQHRAERNGRRPARRPRSARTAPAKRYNVSDGTLVLTLQPMEKGLFLVRSPMDPEILASARTVREAFENAYDVQRSLIASRRDWARRRGLRAAG
jgi:predicted RNase H-like HicB family nuclease